MLPWIKTAADFPSVSRALVSPNGLLCAGGNLGEETIIAAYCSGIYPWYSQGQPILWWSPDPRMVLRPIDLRITKSLAKTMRQGKFKITYDLAFEQVMHACAAPRTDDGGTWIVPEMIAAYTRLHERGVAHSVEAWVEDESAEDGLNTGVSGPHGTLVGGLYGMALGNVFFGESMFSRRTDASKVAFATLMEKLKADGFALIDCQQETRHLASFGAAPIARTTFARKLRQLIDVEQARLPGGKCSAWRA
jgi:leucyl/phenylalanyl-tRNA---protein transferase